VSTKKPEKTAEKPELFFIFPVNGAERTIQNHTHSRLSTVYECRCPHDGKKLAEMARPPLPLMHCDHPCDCGRWIGGQIILENETNHILAVSSCPCGRITMKVVGYLVTIQCHKCKTVATF